MAMLVYQSVILSVSLLKKAFQWDLHGAYLETYSISKMLLGNHTCKSHEVYSIHFYNHFKQNRNSPLSEGYNHFPA